MNYHALVHPDAESDIDKAFVWYELNQAELGRKF